MKNLTYFSILAFCAFLAQNCATSKAARPKSDKDLRQLVNWMTGDFSSQAQSLRDTDFFDIRLHIRPIWTSDKTAHWLYVEQATAKAENKPYRQRVYRVERNGDVFSSIVYTLPDEKKWIGAYKTPAMFNEIKPDALILREGCAVILKKETNGNFAGATKEGACESSLRGAKYASSKVTVTPKELLSWDQGFNEKGEQVWGATKGGYEFVKN